MEAGFKDRADKVLELMSDPATAFVLVASPSRDTVAEAHFFAEKLGEADIPVRALVVNRMHPAFTTQAPEGLEQRAADHTGTDLGDLYRNLADFALVAAREEAHLEGLAEQVAPAPLIRVPFLQSDVHDLDGLGLIASHLFPSR
jgi:anion-transporting  ArsA/GET3 family ATPase